MMVCGLCADARGDRFPSVVPLANLGFVFDQLGFLLGEIGSLQLVKLDFPLRVVPRRTRRRRGRRSRDRFAAPSIRTGSSPSKTAGIGCLLSNRTRSDIPAARLVPSAPPRMRRLRRNSSVAYSWVMPTKSDPGEIGDVEPLADHTASQARRVVAAYANDADECRVFLSMLGIGPAKHET
jgi:hypothetical protein